MALIEREALIKAIENDSPEQVAYTKKYAVECVLCMPTIDAAPVVHGRWVTRNDSPYGQKRKYCSACGEHSGLIKERPYCPNCGARMDGGEDDG